MQNVSLTYQSKSENLWYRACNAECQPLLRVSCQEVEFGVRSHLEDVIVPVVLGAL